MSYWSTAVTLITAMTLIIIVNSMGIEAKRGCATFGHSCYGGMGKRTSDILSNNKEILQSMKDDEDPAAEPGIIRSEYEANQLLRPLQRDNLAKIVKQWIQSYRRIQELQVNDIM